GLSYIALLGVYLRLRYLTAAEPPRDDLDDLLAMEPAVLDEDRPRIDSGNRASRDEDPRHVGLERLAIVDRRRALVQPHAGAADQVDVGSVAGQQVDGVGGDLLDLRRGALRLDGRRTVRSIGVREQLALSRRFVLDCRGISDRPDDDGGRTDLGHRGAE